MLTGAELTDMRDEAELALPDTCTIQTPTDTNTKGSVATTYANTYTSVPCRLANRNRFNQERELGMGLVAITDYVLTVAFDQAIEPAYRVVHGGVTYEVITVDNANASWRTTRRATLKLVD